MKRETSEAIASEAVGLVLSMYLRIRDHEPGLSPKKALAKAKYHIKNEMPYDDGTVDEEFEEVRTEKEKLRYKDVLIGVGASITANALYDIIVAIIKYLSLIPIRDIRSKPGIVTHHGISYDPSDGVARHQADELIKVSRLLKELPMLFPDFNEQKLLKRFNDSASLMGQNLAEEEEILEKLIAGETIILPMEIDHSRKKMPNRVRAGFSPALPTPPCMRIRTGRFISHLDNGTSPTDL